jgi:hypothetical protein
MKKPPATTPGGEFSSWKYWVVDPMLCGPRRDAARSAEMRQGTDIVPSHLARAQKSPLPNTQGANFDWKICSTH